jgi:drug/metabolite transporter (DMT)-like permease
MLTAALLSFGLSPVLETPRLRPTGVFAAALLFLTLSALWTFYMQLRAQQLLSATHTALIFMLEPVFAALTSFVVLGERLSAIQWAGATLILLATVLPSLKWRSRTESGTQGDTAARSSET